MLLGSVLKWFCGLVPKSTSSPHDKSSTPRPRLFVTRTQSRQFHRQPACAKTKRSHRSQKKPSSNPSRRFRDEVEAKPPVSAYPRTRERVHSRRDMTPTARLTKQEYGGILTDDRYKRHWVEADLPARPAPTSQRPSSTRRLSPRPLVPQQSQANLSNPRPNQSTPSHRQYPPPRSHNPSQRASICRPSPSNERMTRHILAEVLDALDRALCHTPYAVCGLAAMTIWGFAGRLPSHVSIVCPSDSKDVIKCWAGAHGMVLYPDNPDCFGLTTTDGHTRRVRVKLLDSGFEDLHVVANPAGTYVGPSGEAMCTRASVLGLASLLDLMARAYVRDGPAAASRAARFARRAIAQDIFWVLFRILDGGYVEEGAGPLSGPGVFGVIDDRFWRPFTAAYPESVETFARAGLVRGRAPRDGVYALDSHADHG